MHLLGLYVAAVFLATPPEVSLELTPGLLEAGAKVIDLSGAFRLRTPERYLQWYKAEHTQPALLAEAAQLQPIIEARAHPRIEGPRNLVHRGIIQPIHPQLVQRRRPAE